MATKKPNNYNATAEHEFASLEKLLLCIADEAIACIKVLKTHLSEYDRRHGNRYANTAASFLRTQLRAAKDTASDLRHVAHQINSRTQQSESATDSARNVMGVIAKAMDALKTMARKYDKEVRRQSKASTLGDPHGDERRCGLVPTKNKSTCNDVDGNCSDSGGVVLLLDGVDTVEQLVQTILRDNFNISALSHQITIAEKSLSSSSSSVERVKLVVHDVQEKLEGRKPSAEHDCRARSA